MNQNQQTANSQTAPIKTDEEVEAEYSALLASFRVAARIISIRLSLLLSLAGDFILSIIATNNQSYQSAWVLVLFAGVTTLPLTLLELAARRNGG
jgi:hypothetical protein